MKDPNFAKLISFKIFGLAFSKIFNKALIITGRKKIINKLLLINLNMLYLISFIKTDYYFECFNNTNKFKQNKTSIHKSYLIEGNLYI